MQKLTRRLMLPAIVGLLVLVGAEPKVPPVHVDHPGLKKLGWQQALPSQLFEDLTFFEVVDTLHALDVHHIELTPQKALSPQQRAPIVPEMPAEQIDALMGKLKEAKLDIVSYRAGALPSDETAARKVFEFGKALKLKTIVGTASEDALPMLDKLAEEYKLNVALLGRNRSPEGRSPQIGLCVDVETLGKSPLPDHVLELRLSRTIGEENSLAVEGLRKSGFKGIICVECTPASGQTALDNAAAAINAFADLVTKAASAAP
ncbi:MAG TPA: hypothetical protein VH518_02515 [Tepidisphaeraceae bacterium]|jgi:hypothetical protein